MTSYYGGWLVHFVVADDDETSHIVIPRLFGESVIGSSHFASVTFHDARPLAVVVSIRCFCCASCE